MITGAVSFHPKPDSGPRSVQAVRSFAEICYGQPRRV